MKKQGFVHQFNRDDVKVHSVTPVYNGFFKVNLYELEHAKFQGGKLESVKRELLDRGNAVAVLPYDPVLNKVVFIEQLRIGAMASKASPWLLEVIAGMIDTHESKEQVAIRESQEEAGLHIQQLIPMLDYLSSPGGTSERLYLYLGIVDASNASGVFGLDYEQEDIKVHVFDYNEALDLLQSGEIDNAASVICMQWLALNKQKVDSQFDA